jgi:hypothetical protein
MQLTPIKRAFLLEITKELTTFSSMPHCGNFFAQIAMGTALNFRRPSRKSH